MRDYYLNSSNCTHCNFTPICQADAELNHHTHCSLNSLVTNTRTLARNEMLCMRNNKFQSLFAIRSGAVKAFQVDSNGKEHIKAFYFTGEVLGYRAIHTGFYLSSVVALTETIVCEVPYDSLLELLKIKPELSQTILALISKQLSAGSYVDASSAEQRVAAFIIDVAPRIAGASLSVKLPMSRQDIGNYLGLTAETISRILMRLQDEGMLLIDGKSITIKDKARLRGIM